MYNIFINEGIEKYKKGREIISKIKEYQIVKDEEEFLSIIKNRKLSYREEKKILYFGIKKGKFLKEYYLDSNFAGIKEEYYLTYENNCPYDCLYCYLRDYYNHGAYVFYVNIEDMFEELDNFKEKNKMISCGIVNDSLAYDNLTGISRELVEYFNNRDDILFELRTKSSNIKNLLEIKPSKNILTAFTFSPREIIEKYEKNTAGEKERIEAAVKLQNIGYNIGIRFDPLIYAENWEENYEKLIENIFERLDKNKIKNIGIGSMRYRKDLPLRVLSEVKTDLFYNEFILGVDGKMRYFKKIRLDMYKKIIKEIKKQGNFDIYLGMEPEYIWKEVL